MDCIVAGAAIAILGFLAAAAFARQTDSHAAIRIADKTAELDRALERIAILERMLDESRASILNVPLPERYSEVKPAKALPDEVRAELAEIEDEDTRAEMEADIRHKIELEPDADPLEIARSVIG